MFIISGVLYFFLWILVSIWYHLFSTWRKSFGFSCNKFYQLLLIWRCNYFGLLFEGYFNCLYDSVFIVGFFPFVILKMAVHDLLASIVSDEKLAYCSCIYSLFSPLWLLSGLFSLSLAFNSLIVMCLGVFFFFLYLVYLGFVDLLCV